MTVLLTEAGHHALAAACLEQMRGLPGLSERDAASVATRLQDAKAAAAGRRVTANHYKMLGVPQTCSAEEVRRERGDICDAALLDRISFLKTATKICATVVAFQPTQACHLRP